MEDGSVIIDDCDMPKLPECVPSPPYVAVTVTWFADDVDGVYDTMHALDERTQETGLNVPPAFSSLHDTVPVTGSGELEVSASVAVNCT